MQRKHFKDCMKNKLLILNIGLFFASALFASELPYSVSYLDRGPVIKHATCKLNIYHTRGRTVLNSDFTDLLSLKGYRTNSVSTYYSYRTKQNDDFSDGELSLRIETLNTGKKHHNIATLGMTSGKNIQDSVPLKEFNQFASKTFNMSPTKEYHLFDRIFSGNGQMQSTGKEPFTIDTKKGRKSMYEIYDALPDCISLDSGHSYYEEKYNGDIVVSEMNACLNLYNKGKREVQRYKNSAWPMVTGYSTYATLLTGSFFTNPVLLAAGGGLVGFHFIKGARNSSLVKQLNDSYYFINEAKDCYIKIQEGQSCDPYLSGHYSKKTDKKIEKYAGLMNAEELTLKIADYLATERTCSLTSKKVRKTTLKKILKDVEKTL